MKAVKLFLVFVVVLGGIVATFLLVGGDGTSPLSPPPPSVLEDYRKQFEKDWETAGDWDEGVFDKHCQLISQLGAQNYDVVSLNDLNTSTAVEVVYKHVLGEWEKPSCSKHVVERYMKAVSTIEASEDKASQNPSVKIIKKINSVYEKAYRLANGNLGLVPRFDGENWNSFSAYAARIEQDKASVLSDEHYKQYLSNITEIKTGLERVPARLSAARSQFYSSLAVRIINYFEEQPRERNVLNQLRSAEDKYIREYETNARLRQFVRSFAAEKNNNNEEL